MHWNFGLTPNFYNITLKIIPMLIIFKFRILFEKNFTHFETY